MKIKCDVCAVDICLPGALVFGPPEQGNICFKWHVCRDCFAAMRTAFNQISMGAKRRAEDPAP